MCININEIIILIIILILICDIINVCNINNVCVCCVWNESNIIINVLMCNIIILLMCV